MSPRSGRKTRNSRSTALYAQGDARLAQQSVTPGFPRGARNTASRREIPVQGADGPVRLRLSGAVTCGCGEAAGVRAVASVPGAEPQISRRVTGDKGC